MIHGAAGSKNTAISGMLAAAVATCGFAAAALGPTPSAHATCASFSGINLGSGCSSTFGGLAIALGPQATATASGILTAALAIGEVRATAAGVLNFAAAVDTGDNYTIVIAGNPDTGTDIGTIAVSLGNHNDVEAGNGFGNIATNFGGNDNRVSAVGILSNATNVGGVFEKVTATGVANNATTIGGIGSNVKASTPSNTLGLNTAFSLFGNTTVVTAGPGPIAIAGSILQTAQTVAKAGPGFNINGAILGGAAATATATTVKAAALVSGQKKGTGSAAAANHPSKKLNAHAAPATP